MADQKIRKTDKPYIRIHQTRLIDDRYALLHEYRCVLERIGMMYVIFVLQLLQYAAFMAQSGVRQQAGKCIRLKIGGLMHIQPRATATGCPGCSVTWFDQANTMRIV